jgi:hypothetical protein
MMGRALRVVFDPRVSRVAQNDLRFWFLPRIVALVLIAVAVAGLLGQY